ncbi:ABC transporter permease [Alsobacter sp. SYSU M60028]|uniref:ABC transporter permease n=1 Tax=Alsobacter ponti TaxID=2962936 RepID=A0ABT1LD66_9HYPH|nr:ABC transporter permease [Alsobacter ponti]MCP8939451.1 ABC transporter permease [Alsobacter ponti]
MGRTIARRLVDAIPTLLLVLTLVFVAMRILPGDPALAVLGEHATQAQLAEFRRKIGLDLPMWQQYLSFIVNSATFNFGNSFANNFSVSQLVRLNLPYTVELTIAATIIGTVIAIPVGVASAVNRGKAIDSGSRVFSLIGYAVPDFFLGAVLLIVFALNFGWFPINGGGDGFADRMWHLALPALALGLIKAAFVSRLTRSSLLEVARKDYVRTARAKGASERRVIYLHALRNALLPVITGLGLSILSTLSGSVAIELIFGRPGLGSMLVGAIETRDYPVIQAGIVVFSLFVVLVNLAMDIIYTLVDPRVGDVA